MRVPNHDKLKKLNNDKVIIDKQILKQKENYAILQKKLEVIENELKQLSDIDLSTVTAEPEFELEHYNKCIKKLEVQSDKQKMIKKERFDDIISKYPSRSIQYIIEHEPKFIPEFDEDYLRLTTEEAVIDENELTAVNFYIERIPKVIGDFNYYMSSIREQM